MKDAASGGGGGKPPITTGGGGGASSSGGGGGKKRNIEEDYYGFEEIKYLKNYRKGFEFALQIADKIEKAILGLDVFNSVFNNLIAGEREFIQQTRALAFETQGVTKETSALQKSYEDIGKTSFLTGFGRTEFQKSYINNIKKGIRELKTVKDISTAQLNTETMIGVEANTLAETFSEWHQSFGLTSVQVADVGRGIRDVARFTGVTGENLSRAVQASGDFLKTMRNAATLTAVAAKNLFEIAANAQKMGIAESLNPIIKAVTSTNAFFNEAGPQIQALLVNAAGAVGRLDELQKGVLLRTKQGVSDLAKGLEKTLKMFGVQSLEQIENLPDEIKMRLNLQLKSAFGLELGEFKRVVDSLRESGKGFAERLADINKQRSKNLNLEEKLALAEEERRLKLSKTFEVLTILDESAKSAKDMNEALSNFSKRKGEFTDDLNALGIAWTDNVDVVRKTLMQSISSVNDALGKSGKSKLEINTKQIENALKDPAAFRDVMSQLTKAEQEAAIAQKKGLDPMTKMAQTLTEINDSLREISKSLQSFFASSWMGTITAYLVAIVTGISSLGLYLIHNFNGIYQLFKWMAAKKAQEATESVAGAATRNATGGAAAAAGSAASSTTGGGVAAPPETKAGLDSKKIWSTAKEFGKAAPAIIALGVAAIAIAVAIGWMGSKLMAMTGVDAVTILETIGIVTGVVVGAALLGENIDKLEGPLRKMSEFFSKNGKALAVTMLKGALVLGVMSVGIIALGGVIALMGNGILSLMGLSDPKEVQDIVTAVTSVIWGAGQIALGVMLASGALYALGAAAPYILLGAWTMAIGAAALLIMTPAIITLAAAILKMSEGILSLFGLGPKQVTNIVEGVQAVINGAGEIAKGVMSSYAQLTAVGLLGWISVLFFPLAIAGAAALGAMTAGVVALSVAIINMAKESLSGLDSKKTEAVIKNLSTVANAVESIGNIVTTIGEKISDLTGGTGFLWLGKSKLRKAIDSIGTDFSAIYPTLLNLVKTVIIQGSNQGINLKQAESASGKLKQVATVIESISKILVSLQEKIIPLTKEGWFSSSELQAMEKKFPAIETFIRAFSGFLNAGFISVINEKLGGIGPLREASAKLKAVVPLIEAITGSVKAMSDLSSMEKVKITSMGGAKTFKKDSDNITLWLAAMGDFLSNGVVDTVLNKFPAIQELQEASRIIRATNNMMGGLNDLAFNTDKIRKRAEANNGILGLGNIKIAPLQVKQAPAGADLDNVAQRIQQDAAVAQPNIATITSPELGKIAQAEDEQILLQREMVILLRQFVNMMNGQGAGNNADVVNNGPNQVPTSPPNFFKHKTGKHMQGPQMGITNIGYQST